MHPSNHGADALAWPELPASDAALLDAIVDGRAGWTVRCTPNRRTMIVQLADGRVWFAKLRHDRARHARSEWDWLHVLALLGFRVPVPIALRLWRGGGMVCTAAVPGRPSDALWREAAGQDDRLAAAIQHACEIVAPMVRRLHDAGLVFRDLYWNHLFTSALAVDAGEPWLIDVERVFRPRLLFTRWRVKDLAGLLASLPVQLPTTDYVRFLRAYLRGLPFDWKDLAIAVAYKAARIRAHRPKYG